MTKKLKAELRAWANSLIWIRADAGDADVHVSRTLIDEAGQFKTYDAQMFTCETVFSC